MTQPFGPDAPPRKQETLPSPRPGAWVTAMKTSQTTPPAPRKKRDPFLVFVGMPKYDENLPACTRALLQLVGDGNKLGPYTFISRQINSFSSNKSRNLYTALALETDAGALLNLDADMNLGEEQLLCILGRPERVVGGLYPKKEISLKQSWVANFALGSAMRPDGLWQCVDVGAGALKVDLRVVEDMIERFPETAFFCEDAPWRGQLMHDLWSAGPVTEDWQKTGKPYARYLTDDFYFCWRVAKLGLPVWADCRAQCGHWGGVDFLAIMTLIQELTGGGDATAPKATEGLLPPTER